MGKLGTARAAVSGLAQMASMPDELRQRDQHVLELHHQQADALASLRQAIESGATEGSLAKRLGDLQRHLERLHGDAWAAAESRHDFVVGTLGELRASIDALAARVADNHEVTWHSDRDLHRSVVDRLVAIERRLTVGQPAGGSVRKADPEAAAARARAFVADAAGAPDGGPGTAEVDTDVGPLLVPAQDTVILPFLREHGRWEPEVGDALAEALHPGGTFLDVGAHVGYFSLMALRQIGSDGLVIAVEADPDTAEVLRRNLLRARAARAVVVDAAASDAPGVLPLARSPERNTGDSRTYDWQLSGEVFEVPAVRIDDIVPASVHVDVVKVDVQGTDHLAFAGMRGVIERCRPTILMEFWPDALEDAGGDATALLEGLVSLGYRARALEAPELAADAGVAAFVDAARAQPTGFLNLELRV